MTADNNQFISGEQPGPSAADNPTTISRDSAASAAAYRDAYDARDDIRPTFDAHHASRLNAANEALLPQSQKGVPLGATIQGTEANVDRAVDGLPKVSLVEAAREAVGLSPSSGQVLLRKISSEDSLRESIRAGIALAKQGQPVTFDLDATVPVIGADGTKIGGATQANILYDELQKAYPDKAYVFSKPDLKPGDSGYVEFPAPVVEADGVHVSIKENPITTARELTLEGGTTLPAGSKFAVGTILDGDTLKSVDPQGKIWATRPDGHYILLADAGQTMTIPQGTISADAALAGQVPPKNSRLIVRPGKGFAPDGTPLLDVYSNSPEEFAVNYKPGTQGSDNYAPRPKSTPHLELPENIKVQALTAYSEATADGKKGEFYTPSGFADEAYATAKNYTGRATDIRSAQALLKLREAQGLSGPTQTAEGLEEALRLSATVPGEDAGGDLAEPMPGGSAKANAAAGADLPESVPDPAQGRLESPQGSSKDAEAPTLAGTPSPQGGPAENEGERIATEYGAAAGDQVRAAEITPVEGEETGSSTGGTAIAAGMIVATAAIAVIDVLASKRAAAAEAQKRPLFEQAKASP
jgi:hypothetical protein